MNKAKTLMLSLMCKMKPEHDLVKGYMHDSEAHEQMLRGDVVLTKDDLFMPLPNGKLVFEYKEVWDNFSVVTDWLARSGEALVIEDLEKTASGKTLLKHAEDKAALDKLFTPDIWKGRMKDMENAWYAIGLSERNKYDFLKIRRAVSAVDGQDLREDQLLQLGTDADKIKGAVRSGGTNFADLVKVLEAKGEHLRKGDLLLRDNSNETPLDAFGAWSNFETWYAELEKNGETFTLEDWLTKRASSKTPLELAVQHNALAKIFTPQHWASDPDGMMTLFEQVPADKRSAVDIQDVLNKIIETNFGDQLNVETIRTRHQLFAPLPGPAMKDHEGKPVAIQPLMLKKVWEGFGALRERLQQTGADLNLADLRRRAGLTNDTFIHVAVRSGHFDDVLALVRQRKHDSLTIEDLTAKNRRDQTVLDEIVKQDKVKDLFSPDLWVGRVGEMIQAWNLVPEAGRKDIDFHGIHSRTNMLSLRRAAGPGLAPGMG
jgi:hypothetical protein